LSSPIAHGSLMFVAWPAVRGRLDPDVSRTRQLLVGCAIFTGLMGPDADILLGLLYPGEPLAVYHNGPTHSLFAGLIFAVPFAIVVRLTARAPWRFLAITGALLYESHVVVDWLTWGRGVQMFWPFTETRFTAPFPIFIGVRHSVGAPLSTHMFTVVNDLVFGLVVWWVSRLAATRGARRKRRQQPPRPSDNA
jgi:membrane-bound metal-dependent hydrolase YbcI (DUF457 family)